MGTATMLCLVLFGVLVDSVRVPTNWNEQQRNFGRWGSNHRFETWEPQQTIQRRMIIELNESKFLLPLSAYEPKQANPVDNMFIEPKPLQTMVLSQNGLYIMPQDTQETIPVIKQQSNLPPLLNPRHSEEIQKQLKDNDNKKISDQTWSSDITRINQATSAMLGIPSVDKYKQFKETQLRREMLRRLAQNSRFLKEIIPLVPKKDSYNSIVRIKPQNHPNRKHIVVASEEGATLNPLGFLQQKQDLELMTKKEPVVFVTEGYRNVLVQGPNKKKKYAGAHLQSKEESRKVLNKQTLGDDVDAEKPARKKKVTKVYRIHGNEGKENNGGTSRNLVQSPWEKPQRYFERPEVFIGDDRRTRLRNHLIKNYRDDSLHEPEHDRDNERDDEKERIVEDKNRLRNKNYRDDALHEPENDQDNEREDDEKDDKIIDKVNENDEAPTKNDEKLETDNKETSNDAEPKSTESDDSAEPAKEEDEEEDDEDESESEEENQEQQQVPHSEHADPKPVPTKPIYPGVGQWAKPGLKHRPYIPQHRFVKPLEDEQQQPEGYDVFKNLEEYFENQREKFDGTFGEKAASPVTTAPSFPHYLPAIKPPNPIVVYDPFNEPSEQSPQQTLKVKNGEVIPVKQDTDEATAEVEENDTNRAAAEVEENNETGESGDDDSDEKEETEENNEDEEEESDDEETDDFVPLRLYSQVRNSENEQHEPYDPLEHGRLREVIKDSKIQTVYSEEGYEDAAYDHAGHEKKAEETQGNVEFEKEKLEPKDAKQKNGDSDSDSGHSNKVAIADNPSEPLIDSVASDSIYPTQPSEPSTQSPKAGQTNNFITTQEVKTTQVKDKNNGDVQLEIQSEVKVIVQPNNSTKAHKYIKIYPKVLRDIVKDPSKLEEVKNSTNIVHGIDNLAISEPSSTTESSTVSTIESMTSSEKPKVVVKVLEDDGALKKINDKFSEIEEDALNNRQKRSPESAFEDVEIDTGFIDKINHTFTPPKPEIDVEKYPYYVLPDLNENSPLRYAENLNNIPVKRAGELSFYKQADKLACPEIPRSIDPIPDHVKNAHLNPEEDEEEEEDEDDEESDEEDEEESVVDKKHPATPKTPRIQLGDTIDCLKIRYFGDNPLDSPFFKEETVGPVKSIFKELDRKASQGKSASELSKAYDKINGANEILNKKDDRKFESEVKDKIFNTLNESAQKFDDVNKQQSNAKTIDFENAQSITTNIRVPKPSQLDNSVAPIKKPSTPSPLATLITTPKYTIQLKPKNIYDQIKLLDHLPEEYDDDIEETEVTTKPLEKTTVNSERQPKLLLHEGEKRQEGDDSARLQAEALRRRRISRRPGYQIFDVNRYLTTTPLSVINSAPSTVLPKHKVISEVFYKDEIKPNEQLTVFADVLNNIKNSSNGEVIPVQSASNFAEPSGVTVSSLDEARIQSPPNNVRVKKFQIDSSNQKNSFDDDRIAPIRRPSYNIQNDYYHHPNINQKIGHKAAPIQVTAMPKQINEPASSTSRTRKILKRRRKPTTTTSTTARTTTNIRIPNQNTPSNHQPYVIDFIGDSEEVVGLVPPQSFQYRTIVGDTTDSEFKDTNDVPEKVYDVPVKAPNPTTVQVSNVRSAPVTETSDEIPPTRSMNKYYFLGLKPPVHQRARPYSEFTNNNILINDNLLLRRVAHIGLSRTKRSATRPAYADLSRNRGRQNEGLEKASTTVDDVDDYVPHRPKNYHYDEKTGKIVYHNTPSRSKPDDDEEVEYEEIEVPDTRGIYLERAEDATHPTPEKVTTKRLLATATPPAEGQGLLDFVAKLKNNPSYVYIPDPTTPKPGSKPSTTEGFVTPDPKSTDPPEFLSILSKVKTDKNYKYIEDPKEAQNKAKKKTTTPEPESDEYVDDDDEEDGESLPEHIQPEQVQNSPGAQGQDLAKNVQIFDIGDYLPKVKTVAPKTTIDYSKYKTIERPHTKQTIEEEESPNKEEVVSRPPPYQHNTGGQPAIEETPIVSKPVILEERESIDTPVVSEEKIGHHKYEEALPSTTQRIVQLRRGTRPSTQSTETTEPTTRRSANRRRPVPTSIRGTRRPTTEVTEPTEKVERVYPEYYSTERSYSDSHPQSKRVYRRRPVRIRHTTERLEEDDETIDKIVRRSLEAKMKDIRKDFEKEALEDSNVEDSYEEIKDEITNDESTEEDKEDEKSSETEKKVLSSNPNSKEAYDDIKEDILYDDDEESDVADETSEGSNKTETVDKNIKDVEIINKDYNKTQTHGGNYGEENDEKSEEQSEDKTTQEQTDSASNEEPEKRSLKQDNKGEATINQKQHNKDVEIINKNYYRSLKHGGNYRKIPGSDEEPAEDETKQEDGSREKLIIEPKKSPDVVIIDNQYDKTKKHGGNYKSEEDAETDELLESKQNPEETQQQIQKVAVINERSKKPVDAKTENKLKRKIKPTTTEISKAVPRLSDVVPKPDHFYTDPNLPRQINKLGSEKLPVNLASEELAEVAAEGDILIEDSPKPQTQQISLRRRTFDKDNDEEDEAAAKSVSTKKPLYVKDPSKRLYFYVPA